MEKKNKIRKFKLLFRNQAINTTITYTLVRETKDYVFLKRDQGTPYFTFRVHKRTLNVKGINEKEKYKWDIPTAVRLIEIDVKSGKWKVESIK